MNSSIVCAGVAPRSALIAGRIGSTRPMPMKAITQAKATAQTAFGCFEQGHGCGVRGHETGPPTNIYLA